MNPYAGGRLPGSGPTLNVTTHLTVGAGVQVAQVTAALNERDERIKAEIYDSIRRGRWEGAFR